VTGLQLALQLSEPGEYAAAHPVAALYCRPDSIYKTIEGVDAWDEARDARKWPGGTPLVAHPPCRLWARLRQFAKAANPEAEMQMAVDAARHVQRQGGVLEHPEGSTLWRHMNLPLPGQTPDRHGGWTAEIRQCDWGHRAEKLTWLYIVGCTPDRLPAMPARREPTGVVKPSRNAPRSLVIITKPEREHTPPALACWLVELARRTR